MTTDLDAGGYQFLNLALLLIGSSLPTRISKSIFSQRCFSTNNSCTSIYLLKMLLFHSNSLKRIIITIKKLKLSSSKLATLAPDVALHIIKVNKNYSIAQNTTFFIKCCHLLTNDFILCLFSKAFFNSVHFFALSA